MLKQAQQLCCFVCEHPQTCRPVFNTGRAASLPSCWPDRGQRAYCHTCLHLLCVTVGNPQSSYKPLHIQPLLLLLLLPSPFSFLFHSLFQSVLPLFLILHPLLSHGLTRLLQSVAYTYRAGAVRTPGDRRKPWTDDQRCSLKFAQRLCYFQTSFFTFMTLN